MSSTATRVPDLQALSVVLVGSVNYRLLHPEWFRANDLLAEEEARSAEVEIVHPEVAAFSVPDAFDIRGENGRLAIDSMAPQWYETVRDLAVGVLRLATETVGALGINRSAHWDVGDNSTRDIIGRRLAPPDNWEFMSDPKVETISMRGERPDENKGHVSVRVEPSVKIRHGVFVATNDHVEFPSGRVEAALEILENDWTNAMVRAEALMRGVLGEV